MDRRAVATLVIAAVAVAAAVWLLLPRGGPEAGSGPLAGLEDRAWLGAADAPVQVLLFEDFRCPHCAEFTAQVMPRVEREFVAPGVARVAFLHFPVLGPASERAALAATCVARQSEAAFWELEPALMRSQDRLGDERGLREVVRAVVPSLDAAAFDTCLASDEAREAVRRDAALARELGLRGTPAVLVDGAPVEPTWPALEAAIRAAAE